MLYLSNPKGIDRETQRASLDTLNRLNDLALKAALAIPRSPARIQAYEMAYRLQASAPELLDLASEPKEALARYGITDPTKAELRPQLPARPAAPGAGRAVRAALPRGLGPARRPHRRPSRRTPSTRTRRSAALVVDLKERGLLDDTIVIWGGEFGRTPMMQGGNRRPRPPQPRVHHVAGRRRHQGGATCTGKTDDFGFNVVEDPVHVHDLNATLLHLLGFDHTKLTYRFQGRDYRLTDVHGNAREGHPRLTRSPAPSAPRAPAAGRFDPQAAAARLARAFATVVGEQPAGVFRGGAAVAVWQDGKPLFSAHGGEAAPGRAWTAATPCLIWSASKGVAAACALHALHAKGIPLHAPVATLWPEFAAAGKERITLAELLSHRAGLAAMERTGLAITDHEAVAAALAAQPPNWPADGSHGYGARTFGFLLDELVRRRPASRWLPTGSESSAARSASISGSDSPRR